MRKLIVMMLILVVAMGMVFASGAAEAATDTIEGKIAAGQNMSDAELLAKAKEETGDFLAYGNTSRIAKAMTGFVKKYGAELGLTEANALGTKMNDTEIYTTLGQEASSSTGKAASMVMIQDGAQLSLYRQGSDILANYVPGALKGYIAEADQLPLAHQYINKLFIWNNIGDKAPAITNVWQLTEPAMANRVFFKNPSSEQVNMNFLVMCTRDDWAGKLAQAYKEYYGKDIELGSYKNAGYKWVAEFLANCNFSISSDTTICQTMAKADSEGCIGLFVLSKFRDVDETIKGNLSVGAFQETQIAPFAGFMYPIYCQIAAKGPRPYTAMLFINYLMSEEGFKPWGGPSTDILGAYSTNSQIGASPADQPYSFWTNVLVAEDGDFILANKTAVVDFVNAEINKKK